MYHSSVSVFRDANEVIIISVTLTSDTFTSKNIERARIHSVAQATGSQTFFSEPSRISARSMELTNESSSRREALAWSRASVTQPVCISGDEVNDATVTEHRQPANFAAAEVRARASHYRHDDFHVFRAMWFDGRGCRTQSTKSA